MKNEEFELENSTEKFSSTITIPPNKRIILSDHLKEKDIRYRFSKRRNDFAAEEAEIEVLFPVNMAVSDKIWVVDEIIKNCIVD